MVLNESSPNSELKFLSETRATVESLRSFMKEFNIKSIDQKEDIFRILYCMSDLPIEYLEKIRTRWNEYSSKNLC